MCRPHGVLGSLRVLGGPGAGCLIGYTREYGLLVRTTKEGSEIHTAPRIHPFPAVWERPKKRRPLGLNGDGRDPWDLCVPEDALPLLA